MTPAEELAAAADKLEALASAASHGPWIEAGFGDSGWSVIGGDYPFTSGFAIETEDSDQGKADAAYIAAMNPLVGKALAEMLRDQATSASFGPMMPPSQYALRIARLINGAAS